MNKLFTYLSAAAICGASALSADAAQTIIINIDNPDAVTAEVWYETRTLSAGENVFTNEEATYGNVTLRANDGFIIESVSGSQSQTYMSNYFSAYPYEEGTFTYTVKTGVLADMRTGSFTLNVDNAEKILAQLSGTYATLPLQDGANPVAYIPNYESQLNVRGAQYGQPLYKVTVNGEEKTSSSGDYTIFIEEGMVVDVLADFPDIDVPVTFEYLNDGADFINKVTVNGEQVDLSAPLSVKCGSTMEIFGNTADFQFNSMKVNNSTITYFYNSYSFTVLDPTTITVDATKYSTLSATVNVNDPAGIVVYKGYSYQNNIAELTGESTVVEVPSNNPYICIRPATGYTVSEVRANGELVSINYNNDYQVTVTDGIIISAVVEKIVRDNVVVIYANDATAAQYGFYIQNNLREQYNLATGYQEIYVGNNDGPFNLSAYAPQSMLVYLNGETVDMAYEGATYCSFENLANNDVIKIYLNDVPVPNAVKFEVEEEVEAKGVYDLVVEFDPTNNLLQTALPGTRYDITAASSEAPIKVTVNNEEIEAEEGHFIFEVTTATKVVIEKGNSGAVNSIASEPEGVTVYNLQGVKVLENASSDALSTLPAGIYIVNGKKILL